MQRWCAFSFAVFLALAISQAPSKPARAGEQPTPKPSAAKLKWHPRGAKSVSNAPSVPVEPSEKSPPVTVRPAAAVESAAPASSTKASRTRLRDSIMQVSNVSADPATDPFADEKPATSEEAKPAGELPPPSEAPATDAAPSEPPPIRQDVDPFPDEKIPAPRSDNDSFGVPKAFAREEGLLEDIVVPADLSCEEQKKECDKIIQQLRKRDIKEIVVGIVVEGEEGLVAVEGKDYPCECGMPKDKFLGRHWSPTVFTWKATGTCHKPLYFEDVHLERYGHSWNPVVQPFMSAAHFFVSVPLLPYKMGLTPPGECMYTLGYYRPGNCAPYLIDPIPWSVRAGLFQAAGITGFMYIFFPPAG